MNFIDAKKVLTPGMIITWGTGTVLGEIVSLNMSDETASVALVQPFDSPCGQQFAAGTKSRIPIVEIRCIN